MKKLLRLLTMLLLIVTPTLLAGCNNTYRDIEIVASSLNGERSISMYVGEERELTFNVYKLPNNASGRLNFTRGDNNITQPTIVRYNQTNHENVITFTAKSYGTTEIRAIAEGGNTISIEVKVFEKITNFSLKNDLVLVRGDSARSKIDLTSMLFNFYPGETDQTTLEFSNQDNQVITNVNIEDYQDQSEVVIKARSPYLDQTKDIVIKIVDQINPFDFYSGQDLLVSTEQKTSESQASVLYLSANKNQDFSFKKLRAVLDGENSLYDVKMVAKNNSKVLVTYDETKRELVDGNTNFNFIISVGGFDAGEEEIVFEAYYTNVDESVYKVTRTFKVVVLEYPNKIFVNNVDIENLEPIILHIGHHKEITTNVKLDIYPFNAKFDRVEISYNTSNLGGQKDIAEFIEFKQNNEILNNITNFSLPIVARGVKNTEGSEVWIELSIYYGSEFGSNEFVEVVSIPFEVKAGASQLLMEETWQDGVIYVSQNKGTMTPFKGLYVNESAAYLSDVEIRALTSQSSQIARIVPQPEEFDDDKNVKYLPLMIYPLTVGQARFNVVLANGESRQIRVVVVPEISSFNIDYDKANSSPVTVAKYDTKGNIKELGMQMQEQAGKNFIKTKFTFTTDIANYLAQYTDYYKLTYTKQVSVSYDETLKILTVDNLDANGLKDQELIVFKLNLFKIDNFKLVDTTELSNEEKQGYEFLYSIKFNAFLPLSSISFSNTQLALFSESDLGAYYKAEASKETKLTFAPSAVGQVFANITPNSTANSNIKLEYYVPNTNSSFNSQTNILTIGGVGSEYGTYNVATGVFTLDYKASNIAPFDVIARVTYYEKVYIARFTVTPKEYIMPNSIQFSDYIDGIYLDATRPIKEINMFILPSNATHNVIEYDFEASPGFDSTAIKIEIKDNNTKLVVTFNSNIQTEGYGYIVLKPRASITNTSITPSNSRRIRVDIGTGSFKNPYKIYTAEQLLSINVMGLDKHYLIMNRIDLAHITNFQSIGKFTGSFRGVSALSEISGIRIVNTTNSNAGLFTSIEPQTDENGFVANTGMIKDLKISGSLNLTLTSASNVGLIAGTLERDALLENVSVTLTTSNITVSTQAIVNIGGVVGVNKGTIKTIVTNQTKQFASLLTGLGTMTVNYTLDDYIAVNKSFVGGIAGVNAELALITRILQEDNLKLYNANNFFVNLDLLVTGNHPDKLNFSIGLIAGINISVINAEKIIDEQNESLDHIGFSDYIKLGGRIRVENQSNNYVGGIVGENISSQGGTLLNGIVSRVKMASYGEGTTTAYFGGLFGVNNGGQVKNLALQAVEDAVSLGINATMLYSNNFGLSVDTANRVGVFGYDTIANKQIDETFITDNNLNLQAQTFVGAESEEPLPASRRKLVARDVTATLNNYFGDFVVGRTKQDDTAQEARTAVKFTPAEINFLVDEENITNQLVSESSSTLMAYLKLYKAKNTADQAIIDNNRLNTYDFPFGTMGEIILVSLNTEIISILNDGSLRVNKTGVVAIQVYSLLNRRVIKTVYILVTNAFDSYTLNLNNVSENSVDGVNDIPVFADNAISLVPSITAKSLDLGGYLIDIASSTDLIFENIAETENANVVFEKVGGTYILRAVNEPGQTSFVLQVSVFYMFNGNLFIETEPQTKKITFTANYYVGSKKVSLSSSSLELEPIEKNDVLVEIETDMFEDEILIKQYRNSSGKLSEIENNFIIQEKNRLYNISLKNGLNGLYTFENGVLQTQLRITQKFGTEEKQSMIQINIEENTDFEKWLNMSELFTIDPFKTYTYSFEAFVFGENGFESVSLNSLFKLNKIQKLMSIEYNLEKIDDNKTYVGDYVVTFISESNGEVGTELLLKINAQSIGIVSIASFEGSQNADIATGKQEYNYVDPIAKNKNHFRISMFPLQADYDYIRIDSGTNPNTGNQVNTIFSLLNSDGTTRAGAKNVSNGLIVDKNLITGDIYIRYSVEMLSLFNEDSVPFVIKVYKNNQVIYTIDKIIKIKFKQDVSIEIVGKTIDKNGLIFVTRGSTYSFNLTANGYRDSEVVIETTTAPIANLINISIPSRTLTITSNIISYPINNQKIDLLVYGRKIVNGEVVQSSPQEITLVVVEYLILNNSEYIPVKRASNKIASVSIGDTFTLQAEFLLGQTIEYQPAITSIASTIKAFENTITNRGSWQYQMGMLNAQGVYEYSSSDSAWTTLSIESGNEVTLAQTDGYFTIARNKDGHFVFTPHKVLNVENPPYKLRLVYGYDYINGRAEYSESENETKNEFLINVYQMSAIDSPTPIYTIAQLQAMNQGSYYILMNDLVVPSNFTPISTEIGGLDGNNKKIIINSNIAFETSREFMGLFTIIAENALIRNLNIEVTSNVVITISKANTQGVYFGILAGQNNGIITNVSVKTLSNANIRVVFLEPQNSSINYASALVGYNAINGSVTHSRVEAIIYASSSLAGFAGYNRGKIANSYVNNSLIVNTSGRLENKTAGFVVINAGQDGDGGQIIASYVSGVSTNFAIYANSANRIIQSSREVGGFIYENSGFIANSYSNIPISASSNSAGFVFTNYGIIENTYSTSLMKETSEGTYGFIKTNYGTLKNNYFLKDTGVNDTINDSNNYVEGSSPYKKTELLNLNIAQFNVESNFVSYVFTTSNSLGKGVWFRPQVSVETQFNNSTKIFTIGRPELVASNFLAISEMEIDFDRTIENTQTGEVDYVYKNVGEFYQGSVYNPIIISSALEFETKIMQSTSGLINTDSFRIVSDLDYGQDTTSSNLYKLIFAGDIEGNGMEISNYVVNSSTTMASAGLFSKIGVGTSGQGTIKNLEIRPAYINLPNTNAVGALAGTIESATLFNIKVNGESTATTSVMIIGKNLVGGVFGRATGKYYLNNISSNISVTATYRSAISLNPKNPATNEKIGTYFLFRSHTSDILSRLSYSGAVGGVLAGNGTANFISVNGSVVSNSEWASLVFGGVGNGVLLQNIDVTLNQNQIIQASAYAGVVAAEFYGKMQNVNITTTANIENLFRTVTYKPYGLGGVVGLMGTNENISLGQSGTKAYEGDGGLYNVFASLDVNSTQVDIAGGIVAQMLSGKIEDAIFNGTVTSGLTAGGIVGKISDTPDAPIALADQTLNIVTLQAPSLKNLTISGRNGVNSGMVRVENDNLGLASVGGVIGSLELFFKQQKQNNTDIPESIIVNATINSQIRVTSIIYGGDFAGIYAGGAIGKIESSELRTIEIKNLKFASRIVISLKNLNFTNPNDSHDENKVAYGYFVGFMDDENITILTENLVNTTSNTYYAGEVGTSGHYLLYSYIKNGETKLDETISKAVFKRTTASSD